MTSTTPRPVILCILDGWGHAENSDASHNAIMQARTPNLDGWAKRYPISFLEASEHHVGLPDGQMGNSEVGHMNIGAGRVILQDLPRIDRAVEDGSLAGQPALQKMIAALKENGGTAHVMGLLSPGGVHAHQRHMAALANAISAGGVPVAVHAFLDGRDTPPRSALDYIADFEAQLMHPHLARIATVSGRYFAMDRDKRWDRVQKAYGVLVHGGTGPASARDAVQAAYAAGKSDEFVEPVAIGGYAGMRDGDGLVMANFRADRAREILEALLVPDFDGFACVAVQRDEAPPKTKSEHSSASPLVAESARRRGGQQAAPGANAINFSHAIGMVEYSEALNPYLEALFAPESPQETLGELAARAGLTQLRIAETEKYAHVTFFFNGGREEPFEGESRILVPSPNVATYDLQPEMSAPEVTDRLIEAIEQQRFDLIVVNYANGDMVGHTGDMVAARAAVEAVDTCLGRLGSALEKAGGAMLITADHGNAEQLHDAGTGQAHTAHTLNRVPLTVIGAGYEASRCTLQDGRLADIAPTVLALLGIAQPAAMTGKNLLRCG